MKLMWRFSPAALAARVSARARSVFFLRACRRTPKSYDGPESRTGKIPTRHIVRRRQTGAGPSAFTVGMLRDFCGRKGSALEVFYPLQRSCRVLAWVSRVDWP